MMTFVSPGVPDPVASPVAVMPVMPKIRLGDGFCVGGTRLVWNKLLTFTSNVGRTAAVVAIPPVPFVASVANKLILASNVPERDGLVVPRALLLSVNSLLTLSAEGGPS